MPKPTTKKKPLKKTELDGVFVFKLALYLILGSTWLKITNGQDITLPIPIGLIVGLIFTSHEHFAIDRKIEYAVLLMAALIGLFAPFGLYISV